MTKVPSLGPRQIVRALERDGWEGLRQRGSHLRMHKIIGSETLRVTIPIHNPVKRSTLSRILKQARIDVDRFVELL